MLNSPTPFPQQGSYALWSGAKSDDQKLARIVQGPRLAGGGLAVGAADQEPVLISLPLVVGASHGNRTVTMEELVEAAPLGPEEAGEFKRLSRVRAGVIARGMTPRRDARFDELLERERLAHQLEELKAKLADYHRSLGAAA